MAEIDVREDHLEGERLLAEIEEVKLCSYMREA